MARQLTIDTFPVDEVKDLKLPTEIVGFEDLPIIVREILDHCPVVCDEDNEGDQLTLRFEDSSNVGQAWGLSSMYLEQATTDHVRSMVVKGGQAEKRWVDEYGNFYSCLSLKGNNFSHTQLIETLTATERYIGYGLQESAVIERVIKASQVLREAGISTEYILGLAEPKEYLLRENGISIQHQPVALNEYKQFLVNKQWRGLTEEDRTLEAYVEIAKKLERSTYFISMRATDTPYRFGDVMNHMHARKEVFDLINDLHGDNLSPDDQRDWDKYMTKYFLPAAVANLAKLHSLGLVHGYPVGLNLTALGGIVDLDSVHGEALGLGDEPVTIKEIANDIATLGEVNKQTFSGFVSKKPLEYSSLILQLYFNELEKLHPAETVSEIKLALVPSLHESLDMANLIKEFKIKIVHTPTGLIEVFADHERLKGITARWLNEKGDEIRKAMHEKFEQDLPKIGNLVLFDDILKPLGEYGFGNIVDAILDPEFVIDSVAFESFFRATLLHVLAPSYKNYLIANLETLVYEEFKTEDKLRLIEEYLAKHFYKQFEDSRLIDVWLNEEVLKIFKEGREELIESSKPAELPYLFTELPTISFIATSGNKMVKSTHGLGLHTIIEYSQENEIEVIVNQINETELKNDEFVGLDHSVSEDADLIQTLSKHEVIAPLPEYNSKADDLRLTKFCVDFEENEFIVYVEQKPNGKLRFVIAFKDISKRSRFSKLSGQNLIDALKQDSLSADTLFD